MITKYIKPFFFKSKGNKINPPYLYGFTIITLLIFKCLLFIYLAYSKYDPAILGALSSVIGILAGLYFGIIKLYDNSKKRDETNQIE